MKRRKYVVIAVIGIALIIVASLIAQTTERLAAALNRATQGTATPTEISLVADDFTATPTRGAAPLVVTFIGLSPDSVSAWRWDFGDGMSSTAQNPSHTYQHAGIFDVVMTATTASGHTTVRKVGYITVTATASPTAQGGNWVTVVDDEFNTPGLPTHWVTYAGSFSDGAHNCASPSLVQVPGDGYLHLKMAYLQSGACGAGWYTSGMQIAAADGGVNQAITIRWRVVPPKDAAIVRSQRAMPMRWVDDPNYAWYYGESDFCEGSHLNFCSTFLHYGPDSIQVEHDYSIDLTQWHTWRVEMVGHTVTVYIDNMTQPVWVYHGNATTVPLSFKRTVLQQECPLAGCPPASYAGETLDTQVDWIIIQNYQPN